jgi:hypothetical protein
LTFVGAERTLSVDLDVSHDYEISEFVVVCRAVRASTVISDDATEHVVRDVSKSRKYLAQRYLAQDKKREEIMNLKTFPRAALLASTVLASTSLSALAGDVTQQRLMNPDKEPQNWLMVNKDYSSHRYPNLTKSTRTT